MKSNMIVNCSKASMAIINCWYGVKTLSFIIIKGIKAANINDGLQMPQFVIAALFNDGKSGGMGFGKRIFYCATGGHGCPEESIDVRLKYS